METTEIDKLIQSRTQGRKKANLDAALERAADRRQREAYREECRELWAMHLRRLSGNYMVMARDARRRARALETQAKGNTT